MKESANLLMLLLQKSSGTEEVDAEITSRCTSLLTPRVSSRLHRFADRSMELIEDYSLDEFETMFSWECPENMRNRITQANLSSKRKISSLEGPNKNSVVDASTQSTFSRGPVPVTTPPGPTRRDTFRQRKPNTSRPPSMHVDDYVARERNADGSNSSNVISIPRIGSASGRPPSVHVDVFMARQRERQNFTGPAANEAAAKTAVVDENADGDKASKTREMKPDLEDDLQGIDIVFDAEESEPDDKLPFPQPDDSLPQPVIEPRSPHSIVEETESDVNESSHFVSNADENTPSEYSSRMSASRPEMPLTREPSITSEKKFPEQSDVSKSLPMRTPLTATDSPAVASTSGYMKIPPSSVRFPVDSRMQPHVYPKTTHQQTGPVPQGFYDQKFPTNQPPLPLMPPPSTSFPSVQSQNMQTPSYVKSASDVQTQVPQGFHVCKDLPLKMVSAFFLTWMKLHTFPLILQVQSDYNSASAPNSKFGRTSLPSSGSTRPPPPLPPTPPPYPGNPSMANPTSQSPQYFQPDMQQNSGTPLINLPASHSMHTSYPPQSMQPILFRPGSMPVNLYVNSLIPHHGENMHNVSQNLPMSMPSVQPIPIPTQVQPLQPPQMPRPPPPQHLRPTIASSPQSDHPMMQIPSQVYYQQQETTSQQQQQRILQQSGESSQQQDPGMSLQEFFKSPEAIQVL